MSDLNDIHAMSDEDFLSSYPQEFDKPDENDVQSTSEEEVTDTSKENEEEIDESTEPTEELPEGEENSEGVETDETDEEDTEESEDQVDEEEGNEEETDESNDNVDYQAEYEALLKPFKANGVDMQVESVDEAIKLMQMGANYSKKMTALKPNLKMLKMLENNELLDEDKLNLLIDVAKGNPEAISKLVKDNDIDPLDLDTKDVKYTPKNHTVGDNEVELDDVISRIQDTDTFADTMNIVSSKWDESSKRSIAQQPKLLELINEHVSNGIYTTVDVEVQKQRMFGGLNGLSDLEAYHKVGSELMAKGAFNKDVEAPAKVVKTSPKPNANDAKRKDKRKAASPVKSKPRKVVQKEFDPLAMSDEDFENLKL